jgi:hypothetical protein
LPENLFPRLLTRRRRAKDRRAGPVVPGDAGGGYFGADRILHFNGGLFNDDLVLELDGDAMDITSDDALDLGSIEPPSRHPV